MWLVSPAAPGVVQTLDLSWSKPNCGRQPQQLKPCLGPWWEAGSRGFPGALPPFAGRASDVHRPNTAVAEVASGRLCNKSQPLTSGLLGPADNWVAVASVSSVASFSAFPLLLQICRLAS